MRHLSKKRAALVRIYAKRRIEFLMKQEWCRRCGTGATEVHHMAGRIGDALLDESRWLALCVWCHRWVTEHPREAIEQGWSLPRVGGAA